jgi:hypothetical protein
MDVKDTTKETTSSPSKKEKNNLSTAKAKMCSTIHAAFSEFKQAADKQSTDETPLQFITTALKGAALGFQVQYLTMLIARVTKLGNRGSNKN